MHRRNRNLFALYERDKDMIRKLDLDAFKYSADSADAEEGCEKKSKKRKKRCAV